RDDLVTGVQTCALPIWRLKRRGKSGCRAQSSKESAWIAHTHQEDSFDDWARQPLLPRRLSRLGPGVSWYDFDGDGWEDLIVTARSEERRGGNEGQLSGE